MAPDSGAPSGLSRKLLLPAQTVILHFDALETAATFIAYFLLGEGEENTLEMLPR